MYSGTVKAHTSFAEFFKLLVQAIKKLELKKDKVRTVCISANVDNTFGDK